MVNRIERGTQLNPKVFDFFLNRRSAHAYCIPDWFGTFIKRQG